MDLIDRQQAIDALMERFKRVPTNAIIAKDVIENLPSTQSERKTGRWILWNYPGEECARCSACGEEYDQMDLYIGGNDYPNYCPNCGAYMKGKPND